MLVVPNPDPPQKTDEEIEQERLQAEQLETGSETDEETNEEQEPTPDPDPSQVERLEAQYTEERENRIRLEERLKARDEQRVETAPEPPKKVYSRQELRAAVNEGTIDDDQLEEIWAKQNRELHQKDTADLIETRDRKRDTESFVETETDKYLVAHPDVRKVNTPDWQRVKDEYDFFTKMGDPNSKDTELKALRAAFGPNPTRIPERTASHRETVGESSGSQGTSGDRPVDIWNRVPKQYRDYYKKQVADGFKTLADVKLDIPYMDNKH
jgi:hypothetical protein